ncbi:MAG: M15 family metallopeptidase [Prevotella sp.]|jgi:D-alanyl-D-alanine dipeptidase|nr:M15 family metallopeptidase [Prevotella sp.]
MNRSVFYCLFFLYPVLSPAQNGVSKFEAYLQAQELINIRELDATILSDLKYGTTGNFTKTVLYDTLLNIYLHPVAAGKLVKAQRYLKEINPGLSLLVYDAVRPLSVQKKMYKAVQNTPYALYVANPARTGLHNYGMAVDLTICDKSGIPLDMGTAFDFFGKAAGINKEQELINEGVLTRQQVKNRELLRKVMVQAGFLTIRGEWWHFNAVSLNEAGRSYKVIE